MNNHTTADIGKRVHIVMHNGNMVQGRLKESRSRYIVLEPHGRIFKKDIRSLSILRKP